MTQKVSRACGEAIGAGLEHYYQVAGAGRGQFHSIAQQVERGAKRTDHLHGLQFWSVDPVTETQWVILAYNLSEVA